MGLSNYLPSSRLIQPGVCTSTTRPASPFNGQVIYETDTKQTLVWQGSSWVMLTDADTPPSTVLIKTVSVGSGVTSVSVTDVFSSTFDNYLITGSGISSNVDGYGLKIKLNNSTGSTYYLAMFYMVMGSTGTLAAGADNGTNTGLFVTFSSGNSASNFNATLYNPYNTNYTGATFASSQQSYMSHGSGIDKNSVSHTGFTLNSYDGATMTGGTIRVYGFRNTI
jgi:hypothetical protein